MKNSYITQLTYYRDRSSSAGVIGTAPNPPITVALGTTPLSSLGTWAAYFNTPLDTVYNGYITLTPGSNGGQDMMIITFDKPFFYDGESNLIVEFRNSVLATNANNANKFYGEATSSVVSRSATANIPWQDASRLEENTYSNDRLFRPKTTFTFEVPVEVVHTIYSEAGANGKIEPAGTKEWAAGMTPQYTITPNSNYEIASVIIDKGKATEKDVTSSIAYSGGTYTFSALNADHTIHVTFQLLPKYTITVIAGEHGSISPSTVTVNKGTSQSFTITPDNGYKIDTVFVDDVLTLLSGKTYTFNSINKNYTLRVIFAKNPYKITTSTDSHGVISPGNEQEYKEGTSQVFTITPAQGYAIDKVMVDNTIDVTNELINNTYTFENINADHTIHATFKLKNYTITYYDLNEIPNPNPDTYTIADPNIVLQPLDGAYINAFKGWYDEENVAVTVIYTAYGKNIQLWARWKPLYRVTVSAGLHGSIAPKNETGTVLEPGIHIYEAGSAPIFMITPDLGYQIDAVLMDETDVTASVLLEKGSYTFAPLADSHTLSVTFKPIVYSIGYENLQGASNTENPDHYTVEDTAIILLPLTLDDYTFEGWYDNNDYLFKITKIETDEMKDIVLWAKWKHNGNSINDPAMQNVQVYSYMNTVYIVNQFQIPLKSVEITDITGRIIYRSASVQSAITLQLAEGIYIVRVISDDSILNTKVVIRN
jgi:uncharacterized repeat protein (TIGR02543 family)